MASEADWENTDEGERPDLCWEDSATCGWVSEKEPHERYADALLPLLARVREGEVRREGMPNDERHPEDYCHRCGGRNISWYTPGGVWDPVMRPDGESGKWSEIICPLCFVELAGGGTWALIPRKGDGERWTSADERAQIVADAERRALREAAQIVSDCAAQGLGLASAERQLIAEADRLTWGADS